MSMHNPNPFYSFTLILDLKLNYRSQQSRRSWDVGDYTFEGPHKVTNTGGLTQTHTPPHTHTHALTVDVN